MRHFVNQLPDFLSGSRIHIDHVYFKNAVAELLKQIVEGMPPTFDNCDGGLYVGCAGVAYMFYYLAKSDVFADMREDLLTRARNYTEVSLSYATSKRNRDPPAAFLLGSAGVYATGGLVYSALQQKQASDELLKKYLALGSVCQPIDYLDCGSDELFVGRAGYLCGAMTLNQRFPEVGYNLNIQTWKWQMLVKLKPPFGVNLPHVGSCFMPGHHQRSIEQCVALSGQVWTAVQ